MADEQFLAPDKPQEQFLAPDKSADLETAKERVAQPTQFEKDANANANPFARSWNYLKGEGKGLGNVAVGAVEGIPGAVKTAGDIATAATGTSPAATYAAGQDIIGAGKGVGQIAAAPFKAETYRDPEKFGEEVGNVASLAYAPEAPEAAGETAARAIETPALIRGKIGEAIHTPEGALKPGARTASKVAGGAVGFGAGGFAGHAVGIPSYGELGPAYAGYRIGAAAGPRLLEKVFPAPRSPDLAAENPFHLAPDEPVREEPVQSAIDFPKAAPPKAETNPNPFRLTPDEPVSEPAVQQNMQFPVAAAKQPPAVRLPEPELPKGGPQKMSTQEIKQRVDEATGNTPVVKGVPLREQPRMTLPAKPAAAEQGAPKTLAEKYPDKGVRQWVHSNGEMMYDATKDDPEAMKGIHAMTRVDLRQALINSGEDMGDKVVSDSKFAGEGAIPRQSAFERLLAKGYTPKQIVELGQKPIGPHGTVVPPRTAREPELVNR